MRALPLKINLCLILLVLISACSKRSEKPTPIVGEYVYVFSDPDNAWIVNGVDIIVDSHVVSFDVKEGFIIGERVEPALRYKPTGISSSYGTFAVNACTGVLHEDISDAELAGILSSKPDEECLK